MKTKFFSPILILLMITMSIKIWMLTTKIETESGHSSESSVHSVLINTAFAVDQNQSTKTVTEDKYTEFLDRDEAVHATEKQNDTEQNQSNKPQVQIQNQEMLLLQSSNMSNAELKLLQELSQRRQELDKNQEELRVRERVLKATENKIDQKIVELQDLQTKLTAVMKQYNEKELNKIKSLVKIYENMKPQRAAQIFNELEMPILLQVVSNMKEIKVAPIIANMNPLKARDLSIELAKQKTITASTDG